MEVQEWVIIYDHPPFELPLRREFTLWSKVFDSDSTHRWMCHLLQEIAAAYTLRTAKLPRSYHPERKG
ncbi:hypothetical protein [Pseudomonas sp. ADAK13]|uniref:hypothetical protein n=1 Tax=Pseudomonas sp. ADAK13 TaxID=2730847 RepID=UPI0014628435|nr:hypothetical protein [Pseudomonas sp. ADAK13]QJI32842.1 hypothetical protein HKK54_27225 [Pseudomonas sp. ADAK13]